MKQRITVDELNELSDDQKERLREWWKPVYGDFFSNGHEANIIHSEEDGSIRCVSMGYDGSYDYEIKKDCLPLLSIGQMIEILHDRNWFYELSFTKEIEDSPHEDTWHVYTTSVGSYKVKEPCDGLWEAVKEVL